MITALWWLGCNPQPLPVAGCDPRSLEMGELRARRIVCSDEAIEGGEARSGDWLLENSSLRVAIRDDYHSLTQLGRAGGTVIDAAVGEGRDIVQELVPLIDGDWLAQAQVHAWTSEFEAGIRVEGTLPSGAPAAVDWVLGVDAPVLTIRGNDDLRAVPMPGSEVVGSALELYDQDVWALLASDSDLRDEGGWIQWLAGHRLVVAERSTAHVAWWPDGTDVAGNSPGEWVELMQNGTPVGRLEVVDGRFSGRIPPTVDGLRSVAAGFTPGEVVAPTPNAAPPLGAEGWLRIEVVDSDDQPIAATATWNDTLLAALPDHGDIGVGGGTGTLRVAAGPRYERTDFAEVELDGVQEFKVVLEPSSRGGVLADLQRPGPPDRNERRKPTDILALAAGEGLEHVVLTAGDEVAWADQDGRSEDWLSASAGSRADAVDVHIWAWPWDSNSKRNSHGAAPWDGLDALDLLSVTSELGARTTMVDLAWLEAAGPASVWPQSPDLVVVEGIDDLSRYLALVDRWIPVSPVGPLVWIEGVDGPSPAPVEVDAALQAGRTMATSGPRIRVRIDGAGPGDVVQTTGSTLTVSLEVTAPTWMSLERAALFGPDGTELASFKLGQDEALRLDVSGALQSVDWVVAACWGSVEDVQTGSPHFAITGPVWLQHPR